MRMWNVNPEFLCTKHLLGEHVETHMFCGTINKGISIKGYVEKGLVEVQNIKTRHDELRDEMIKRGMKHNSPLPEYKSWNEGSIDIDNNIEELKRRCPQCRQRIEEIMD